MNSSLWVKKFHVSLSGPLLAAALDEKRRLRQTSSGYFRLVVAEFAAQNPRMRMVDFRETKYVSGRSCRFQVGLDQILCDWMQKQSLYLNTDPGQIIRFILHNRLGVPFETEAEDNPVSINAQG